MDEFLADGVVILRMKVVRRGMTTSAVLCAQLARDCRQKQLLVPTGVLGLAALGGGLSALAWFGRNGASWDKYRMKNRQIAAPSSVPRVQKPVAIPIPQPSGRINNAVAAAIVSADKLPRRLAAGAQTGIE